MMMGGGFLVMFLLPLLMIIMLGIVLVIVGGAGMTRSAGGPRPLSMGGRDAGVSVFSSKRCRTCGRPLQADWQVCPYDGTKAT